MIICVLKKKKKIVIQSLQTTLLCIVGVSPREGSVAVAVLVSLRRQMTGTFLFIKPFNDKFSAHYVIYES